MFKYFPRIRRRLWEPQTTLASSYLYVRYNTFRVFSGIRPTFFRILYRRWNTFCVFSESGADLHHAAGEEGDVLRLCDVYGWSFYLIKKRFCTLVRRRSDVLCCYSTGIKLHMEPIYLIWGILVATVCYTILYNTCGNIKWSGNLPNTLGKY